MQIQKQKKYLVVGTWIDKNSNNPVSRIAEIIEGKNKNNQPYSMVNTESREPALEGTYAVGTILTATVSMAQESSNKN